MKTFFIIALVLLAQQSWAKLGACPTHAAHNPKDLRMIEFLREMEGRYDLGSCHIEIQVCRVAKSSREIHGTIIADMLVVDKTGFERYVPFYIPEFDYSKTHQLEIQNSRMLHYRFRDRNYDDATGRDERWAVEFVKTPDLKKLEYIEIGYSSQSQRANKTSKRWIVCGTQREKEVK
ncbi:hypothetical protein DOM22_06120 [Bdellovibrio sp. ZAP7]|uniref:hypothetical protein n=1 Tax=Bdellovibrio sp. ZAP7 TaxID=2231053 RepID=UPI001159BF28|nr:hypothetical protein [Bdellovibrio sp. ZAP7]QDK44770.1 hypothetical protein DOM22_06120 [Bdellovibrio sp. ZAP7]